MHASYRNRVFRRRFRVEVPVMKHKGVNFTVARDVEEPDIWRYEFQLGTKWRTGTVQTRLELFAIRRVQMHIDRELKRLEREPDRGDLT